MSVYIKGMEMPDSCAKCRLFGEYGCPFVGAVGYALTEGRRNKDCPLVPVPDHGRLIDADALGILLERLAADKWNQKAAPVNWSYAFEECLEMVDNAPTIIGQTFIDDPADKEDE